MWNFAFLPFVAPFVPLAILFAAFERMQGNAVEERKQQQNNIVEYPNRNRRRKASETGGRDRTV